MSKLEEMLNRDLEELSRTKPVPGTEIVKSGEWFLKMADFQLTIAEYLMMKVKRHDGK